MQSRGQHYDYDQYDQYQQGSRESYGKQQQAHLPSPWQQESGRNNSLSDLDLELQMMKRKRQMLQEKRQLLEEQQQLDRLQIERVNPWNDSRQYESQPQRQSHGQFSNYADMYESGGAGARGYKRPADPQSWHEQVQPKRYAGNTAPFAQSRAGGPALPAAFAPNRAVRPKFTPNSAPYKSMERQVERDVTGGPARADWRPTSQEIYLGPGNANPSVHGKLELVLGRVVREMREQFFVPPHNIQLSTPQYRSLKEKIRHRIHGMMIGKPLPTAAVMHEMYRRNHTAKGDLRLLHGILSAKVLQHPERPAANAAKSQTPRKAPLPSNEQQAAAAKFLNDSLNERLDNKLKEMFVKLHKIYVEEAAPCDDKQTQAAEEASDVEKSDDTAKKEPQDAEADKEVKSDETPAADESPKETEKADGNDALDKEFEEIIKSGLKPEEEANTADMSQEKYFEYTVDKILKRKLPQVLPRYKNFLISIIAADPQFMKLGIKPVPSVAIGNNFAKVFGTPGLPGRMEMRNFLQQFKCSSIKKHKTIYNLLFVGVPDDDNFKKLLASDGVTVGGKKLQIRVSVKDPSKQSAAVEKSSGNEETAQTNGATETANNDNGEETEKGDLNNAIDDLDTEIEDLLTSINDADSDQKGATDTAREAMDAEIDAEIQGLSETAAEQEEVEGQGEAAAEQAETTEGQAEGEADTDGQAKAAEGEADTSGKEENSAAVEENVQQATPVRTRRSSRVPQKN